MLLQRPRQGVRGLQPLFYEPELDLQPHCLPLPLLPIPWRSMPLPPDQLLQP